MTTADALSYEQVQALLPHRWPMLLIDRVLSFEPGVRAVCLRSIGGGESFFQGHFPGRAVMPGVLQVEAMVQATLVALLAGAPPAAVPKTYYLGSIRDARFLRPVVPGDQLRIEAAIERVFEGRGLGSGQISVDGQVVAKASFSFAAVDAGT